MTRDDNYFPSCGMFVLIKKKRIYKEARGQPKAGGQPEEKAFGRHWAALSNSEPDVDLYNAYEARCLVKPLLDGLYLFSKSGFKLIRK